MPRANAYIDRSPRRNTTVMNETHSLETIAQLLTRRGRLAIRGEARVTLVEIAREKLGVVVVRRRNQVKVNAEPSPVE